MQTWRDVRGISDMARKAEMTALKTAAKLETRVQQMKQKLEEQQKQSAIQVQAPKVDQDRILQQSAIEAQVAREAQAKIAQ